MTNADGSATPVKLSTDDDANYSTPSWSPDGRRILVSKSGGSGFGVYFVDAVTGTETKFSDNSDGNEQAATWSPDGTRIALSSFSGTDGGSLVVVNADGTNRRVLPGGQANAPRWRGAAAGGTGGTGGTTNGIAVTVPGRSNIYLAGAAPGTTASTGQDTLANATPFQVPGVTLTAGASLSFSATGNVSNDPANPVSVGPDGGPYLGNTFYGHDQENGLPNLVAPINSLIGVFLNDTVPAAQGFVPPGTVNDENSINYSSIRPGLRQPFYIGDGKDTNGRQQTVIVPAGATRLFLGALDPSDQENNLGSFAVTILGAGGAGTTGGGGTTLAVTDATVKSTSDATGGTAIPGDTLTYNFTVRNPGTTAATGISITTVLNGTKFKSLLTAGGEVLNPTVNGSQLVLSRFNLAPGASLSLVLKVKVPATFPTDGRTVGLGFASVTADGTAPLTGLAGLNSTVLPPYQTLVSYNSNVGPGDVLTFRFTTTNRSTIAASNVTSVVSIPAGVNFLSANADSARSSTWPPTAAATCASSSRPRAQLRRHLRRLRPHPLQHRGQRHPHPARHPAHRRRHHLRRARRDVNPQRQPRRQPAQARHLQVHRGPLLPRRPLPLRPRPGCQAGRRLPPGHLLHPRSRHRPARPQRPRHPGLRRRVEPLRRPG